MAVPFILDPNQKIFIAQTSSSSPYFTDKTETNDAENSKKMFYHYPLSVRKEIQAIRQSVNVVRDAGCAKFYSNYITNEIGKGQLEDAVKKADVKMKLIDPTLKAEVLFFELSTPALASGNMLDAMLAQIRTQVHEVVLAKIKETIEKNTDAEGKVGKIPVKTRNSLIRMLDRVQSINIVNDPNITERIAEMKRQIEAENIIPLQNEIMDILNEGKGRFASMDIIDENEPATAIIPEKNEEADREEAATADKVYTPGGSKISSRIDADDWID